MQRTEPTRRFSADMLALLLPLVGFAFLDSLNVLNLGVTTAVVYDSRLRRRSPLPAGLSFVGGVFAATTTFGVGVVLGLTFLTTQVDIEVTPTVRYWGQLVLGLVLIAVAALTGSARGPKPPEWALQAARRNPWLFGIVGLVVGFGQAATSVPYLTALAMISARNPLPSAWPVFVVAYCAMALLPALLVLGLSVRKTMRARRIQRTLVRVLGRYGPVVVRTLFMGIGLVLVIHALTNYAHLW
jgi:cytochrome c biogenesis protein CcdA